MPPDFAPLAALTLKKSLGARISRLEKRGRRR
jgi:hypothetical protein